MKWISRLYVFFLGVILTITTGFGVAAFYPQPVMPSYPQSSNGNTVPQSCYSTPESQGSADCQNLIQKDNERQQADKVLQDKYQAEMQTYQNKNSGYTRTAIFFGIAIGAIYAIMGLGLIKKSKMVATGLLLAGLLSAILTRILIGLASLGASVTGTNSADFVAYAEFGILFILSAAVIMVGLYSLKDTDAPASPAPATTPLAPNPTVKA